MSMIANLLQVSSTQLEAYLQDSSLLESHLYDEETADQDLNLVDIDKAWDGIVFLLTGQGTANADHPLVKVLFSGQLVNEEQDLGYGPAHYLTAAQVAELNGQLAAISMEDLELKFDPEKMKALGIYPDIWDEEDEAFDYLASYFISLQQVYAAAAKNGQAMITFLN